MIRIVYYSDRKLPEMCELPVIYYNVYNTNHRRKTTLTKRKNKLPKFGVENELANTTRAQVRV